MSVSLLRPPPPPDQRPEWMQRTLGECRERIVAKAREGTACPCCGQRVQLYRRKFNSGMAATLIAIWRELVRRERRGVTDRWVHVEHDLVEQGLAPRRARDFSVARFWGVIEPKARATRSTGAAATDTGYWTVTALGRQLCLYPRRPLIRKYCLTFNNAPQGFDGPEISLAQALKGSSFDLADLLAGGIE